MSDRAYTLSSGSLIITGPALYIRRGTVKNPGGWSSEFVDPDGGPFIQVGGLIDHEGQTLMVTKIEQAIVENRQMKIVLKVTRVYRNLEG